MKNIFTGLVMVGAVAFCAFPALAVPKGCVFYEPGEVTLKGKLRHSSVWTLDLTKPVCIEGKENDKTGMYPTEDAVRIAVLNPPRDQSLDKYRGMIDREVVIVGTLYHKFDTSADTVMMNVATITPSADVSANTPVPSPVSTGNF